MTTKEMRKARHKPGYWFENVAPIGEKPDWKEKVKHSGESEFLFGHEPKDLMAKQYK